MKDAQSLKTAEGSRASGFKVGQKVCLRGTDLHGVIVEKDDSLAGGNFIPGPFFKVQLPPSYGSRWYNSYELEVLS